MPENERALVEISAYSLKTLLTRQTPELATSQNSSRGLLAFERTAEQFRADIEQAVFRSPELWAIVYAELLPRTQVFYSSCEVVYVITKGYPQNTNWLQHAFYAIEIKDNLYLGTLFPELLEERGESFHERALRTGSEGIRQSLWSILFPKRVSQPYQLDEMKKTLRSRARSVKRFDLSAIGPQNMTLAEWAIYHKNWEALILLDQVAKTRGATLGSRGTALRGTKQVILLRQLSILKRSINTSFSIISPEHFLSIFRAAFDVPDGTSVLDRLRSFELARLTEVEQRDALVTYTEGATLPIYFSQLGEWRVLKQLEELGLADLNSSKSARTILNAQHPHTKKTLWHRVIEAQDREGIEFLLAHRANPHLKDSEGRIASALSFSVGPYIHPTLLLRIFHDGTLPLQKRLELVGKLTQVGWDPYKEGLMETIPASRLKERVAQKIFMNFDRSERMKDSFLGYIDAELPRGADERVESGIEHVMKIGHILELYVDRLSLQLDKWRWSWGEDIVPKEMEEAIALLKAEAEVLQSKNVREYVSYIEACLNGRFLNKTTIEKSVVHTQLQKVVADFQRDFRSEKLSGLLDRFSMTRKRTDQQLAARDAQHAEDLERERAAFATTLRIAQEREDGLISTVAAQNTKIEAQDSKLKDQDRQLQVQAQRLTQLEKLCGVESNSFANGPGFPS